MSLDPLQAAIEAFHQAAFVTPFPTLAARKKAMLFAARSCPDLNIQNILGGSVDYLARRPELVRASISKAYAAVDTLRENGPK